MAIVLTSTTSSQEEMNRVVSAEGDEWRKPPVIEEPKPDVEETKADAPESVDSESAKEADKGTEKGEAKSEQPRGHKAQKRIDQLTKEKHDYESKWKAEAAEKEALKRELAVARGEIPEEIPETEPVWEEFQAAGKNMQEFLATRDAYRDFQKVRSEKVAAYNKSMEEAVKKYPDWNDAAKQANDSGITFTQKHQKAFWAALEDEPNAPDVLYYTWKHPEEARVMASSTPEKLAKIVGKIAERLSATNPAPKPVSEKPKAKPPEPIAPVGASATRQSIPMEQLSPSEYIKVRNKQEREARRR